MSEPASPAPPLPARRGLAAAFTSWRVGSLSLLSLSSGLPQGIILTLVPTWLTKAHVDIKTVGLLTLAQAPYAFKFLWAPLMDRYRPGVLGRKRGWVLVTQVALALSLLALATQAGTPVVGVVAALSVLVAFASASQDIAIDGYAVEVLEPAEQGPAVGLRIAAYRAGMWLAGAAAISVAAVWGWPTTFVVLGFLFLALVPVTVLAPEPSSVPPTPPSLRAALWEPFVGFLSRPRALEIAAFVVLYRLGDNLAVALLRPFLVERGYSDVDVGVGSGSVVLTATLAGTFLGGVLTTRWGVGRALWRLGVVQAVATLGYAVVAVAPISRPLMYGAMGLEALASGMGTGAFSVLLLRLTQKRFSATQYAFLSSLFALARTIAGPPAGALAWAIGWGPFFGVTVLAAVPGLLVLHRFVPFQRPEFVETADDAAHESQPTLPWSTGHLVTTGLGWAAAGVTLALSTTAALASLRKLKEGLGFPFAADLVKLLTPASVGDALGLAGALIFGGLVGLLVAAGQAARGQAARGQPANAEEKALGPR